MIDKLHGLTEAETDMAIQFFNEQKNGERWGEISSRLLWADVRHQGLNKLLLHSIIQGGVPQGEDTLRLIVQEGQIVFS